MDSDKLVKTMEHTQKKLIRAEKKLLKINMSLISSIIQYLIALWIYLGIYDHFVWHRCLIAIGVGFIVFSLRSRAREELAVNGQRSRG